MKRKHLKHLAGTLLVFTMAFCVGAGAGKLVQSHREKAVSASAEGNWGLSFPQEGQPPVGNATADYLKQFGAYYVQNTNERVLYLTFDAGYENGNKMCIRDSFHGLFPNGGMVLPVFGQYFLIQECASGAGLRPYAHDGRNL